MSAVLDVVSAKRVAARGSRESDRIFKRQRDVRKEFGWFNAILNYKNNANLLKGCGHDTWLSLRGTNSHHEHFSPSPGHRDNCRYRILSFSNFHTIVSCMYNAEVETKCP